MPCAVAAAHRPGDALPAKIDIVLATESAPRHDRLIEVPLRMLDADGKSRIREAILDVASVDADVIGLAEQATPRLGIGDRRVLERDLPKDRHLDQRDPFGAQYAVQFRHRRPIVRDVLQDVAAVYEIERVLREGHAREVRLHHHAVRLQVERDVSFVRARAEKAHEGRLGSDVENAPHVAEQSLVFPQEHGHQAVALEGAADGTSRLRPRRVAERRELAQVAAATDAEPGHAKMSGARRPTSDPPAILGRDGRPRDALGGLVRRHRPTRSLMRSALHGFRNGGQATTMRFGYQ